MAHSLCAGCISVIETIDLFIRYPFVISSLFGISSLSIKLISVTLVNSTDVFNVEFHAGSLQFAQFLLFCCGCPRQVYVEIGGLIFDINP